VHAQYICLLAWFASAVSNKLVMMCCCIGTCPSTNVTAALLRCLCNLRVMQLPSSNVSAALCCIVFPICVSCNSLHNSLHVCTCSHCLSADVLEHGMQDHTLLHRVPGSTTQPWCCESSAAVADHGSGRLRLAGVPSRLSRTRSSCSDSQDKADATPRSSLQRYEVLNYDSPSVGEHGKLKRGMTACCNRWLTKRLATHRVMRNGTKLPRRDAVTVTVLYVLSRGVTHAEGTDVTH
jgi:hypothetical protein